MKFSATNWQKQLYLNGFADGCVPVLMDSGIRGGADAFKAIAIGAKAVCIGRPYVYGLAIAGESGVYEVLLNMLSDLELTMALAGCRNIKDVAESTIVNHNFF